MEETLRGLRGDWLNGWLAAAGITVLLPGTRLAWTTGPSPVAIVTTEGSLPLAEAIEEALPSVPALKKLAIAPPLHRTVTPDEYRQAAEQVRQNPDDFSLSMTLTDLAPSSQRDIEHSRLDVSGPGTVGTICDRLIRCRNEISDGDSAVVAASLRGAGRRIVAYGLGLDFFRLPSERTGAMLVDPVIECLAFWGLSFFPVRGDGSNLNSRGWSGFTFWRPVWTASLDRWGIDALLGQAYAVDPGAWGTLRLGITSRFQTISYRRTGAGDTTSAFASRRRRVS